MKKVLCISQNWIMPGEVKATGPSIGDICHVIDEITPRGMGHTLRTCEKDALDLLFYEIKEWPDCWLRANNFIDAPEDHEVLEEVCNKLNPDQKICHAST